MKRHFALIATTLSIFSSFLRLSPQAFATTTEPEMVVDISPGSMSGYPESLTVFNNALYFAADDGTNGTELWKTDGTAEGTVMAVNIRLGSGSSNPKYLTAFNNALYFTADDGTHGVELWKTDGTEAGTEMVADINPDGDSEPYSLTAFNNALYFGAYDDTHGYELWKSDGTDEGTIMVKDINPSGGSLNDYFDDLIVFNNALYFGADDGTHGVELWKTDGTEAGTVLVADINPDGDASEDGYFGYFAVFNNALYFAANDGVHHLELWKSDGTAEGTVMVKDINPTAKSLPYELTVFNNALYFGANDGHFIHGWELWKSDGTEEGTVMVADINPSGGSLNDYFDDLIVFNNALYFGADDGTHGRELWKSDGTEEGTVMVADINPSGDSEVDDFAVFNNALYFGANDDTNGYELWKISIIDEGEDDEGGSPDDSGSSDSSKSISSTLKKSSQASSPNVVPGWKHPVMAGPNFTGTHGFIPNTNITSDATRLVSIYLDVLTHHDDLYIHHSDFSWMNILAFWNNPDEVTLPWTQGFNAVSEISKIEAKASFNGYPVTETDNPFIILLGYDPNKVGNIPTEQLKIARFNEVTKKWETIKGAYVYPDGKIATVTNKFGYFSVVYPRSWWGSR